MIVDLLLESAIVSLLAIFVILTMAAYTVYAERKISAKIQMRIGPNRVGPLGLLQPLADAIKLIMKEDVTPTRSNQIIHFIAPVITVFLAIMIIGALPFAKMGPDNYLVIFNSNIGVLYILAINSIAVYGVTLAGWASNSKYSLLGGLRSSAQMLSYELAMGLCIVSVILLSNAMTEGGGYLRLTNIVEAQRDVWFAFINPIGFLIFVVTSFAETNRGPFDLVEAEQELVGGFHTEYSAMKFGSFFVGEYTHVILASAIISTLFLGGYLGPFESALGVAQWATWAQVLWGCMWFLLKTSLFIFIFIWVRWTLPRFKYNQLMDLGWRSLLPLSIANLLVVAFVIYLFVR
jgi:NADH-quinone oxidoreductase subunit H